MPCEGQSSFGVDGGGRGAGIKDGAVLRCEICLNVFVLVEFS